VPEYEGRESAKTRHSPNFSERPVNTQSGRSGTACDLYLTNPKQIVSDEKHEGGKHTVKPGGVDSGFRHRGGQPADEIYRFKDHMGRAALEK